MSAHAIEVEIYPEQEGEEGRAEQEETLAALRDAPGGADAQLVDKTEGEEGILPVVPLIIIAAVLGAVALGKFIENWVCHQRRRGMIIDARGAKLRIVKDADLPGGEVLIFAKDGSSKEVNVCDDKTEISALVSALDAGATADEAADQAKTDGKDGNGEDGDGKDGNGENGDGGDGT
jgi:hypothetical protein